MSGGSGVGGVPPASRELVEVAPREVGDLVYECCRILGLDGGVAEDVARSVTTIEICFGDGVAAFDREIAAVAASGGSLLGSAFVLAPERWRDAELEVGDGGAVPVRFDPVPPLAALGAVLEESLARGIGWPGLDRDLTGLDRVDEVELTAVGRWAVPDAWRHRRAEANRRGLQLPLDLVERLNTVAAAFLVSEAAVDAACGIDPED